MASTSSPSSQPQRERLLVSMAESCAARGFAATRIADLCESAGVSRATFYELFRDKDDCLRAAMELSLAEAMATIAEAYSPEKDWATTARDTAAALLDLLTSYPDFAHMALVEAPSAGPSGFDLYDSGKRMLQALLDRGRDGHEEGGGIPSSAGRAALAAAESLVVGRILTGHADQLPELLPDVVYIVTVPYLGQEEALRQVREAERALPVAGA